MAAPPTATPAAARPPATAASTAESYFAQGNALQEGGKNQEAIEAYTKVIERNPRHSEAYRKRAVSKLRLQQYQEAISDYDMAIQLDPSNSSACVGRGTARRRALSDVQGALADYAHAIELDPGRASAYYSRGELRSAIKDFEGAERDCQKSISLDPRYSDGYLCLGLVDSRQENYDQAIEHFGKAIEFAPGIHFGYLNRAIAYKDKYGIDATFTGSFRRLYFQRDEPPFDSLRADNGLYILALDGKPDRRLEMSLSPAHELIPFFDVNPLPDSFSYPWRKWSPWACGLGLALFLVVPYPRRPHNVIAYQRWRTLFGDIASTLLFATFFVLPLPIIGGSVEAVTNVVLVIPFWLLTSLGLCAFYWSAHTAVYCLVMRDGGFDIRTLGGQDAFEYADIQEVQGALLRPPKWLVVVSFAAVLFGGSRAARMGQTGRALMLAGSAVNGMRVTRKSGRPRWV